MIPFKINCINTLACNTSNVNCCQHIIWAQNISRSPVQILVGSATAVYDHITPSFPPFRNTQKCYPLEIDDDPHLSFRERNIL